MLQGGHHRLKAAQTIGLKTINVNEIVPYRESVEIGITELPIGKVPK